MKPKYKIAYRNILTTVLFSVIILLGFFYSLYLTSGMDTKLYDNKLRIELADINQELVKGNYVKSEYPYIVFNLDGRVLYADEEFDVNIGSFINPQEMIQTDRSSNNTYGDVTKEVFLFKNKRTDKTNGFIVFLVPTRKLLIEPLNKQILQCMVPFAISVLVVMILQFIRMILYNDRILKPIREISRSANHIIAGNYDYEVLRVNGTKVRKDEIGDLVYTFELMRDELKEKQLREEQLKKSQQELISCISHDLKTPISTIKAYGEGLRDGIARTEESRLEFEEIIIHKTDLLNQMISELLEYSNAQLNELEIIPKEIYFLPYFNEVAKELQGYAMQRGILLTYQEEMGDMIVNIDCRRVTEVLYNLVENSIKYMGEKPGKIEIIASRQDHGVLIRVKDNGIGINADDIPYVFDKFYRAEKSRTSSIPGSGLGLSICKYIIESLGGIIYCKNRNEGGCEIGFTLI